jgi:serine/threonine-protein kinase
MRAPSAGQVLGGKYRLVRHLGKGGLAAVWFAEHLTLHSPVALKIIDPVAGDEEDALQRFLREARAAAALRSPHVVQILDYGVDDDVPYIVMELLEGESLEQRLDRVKRLALPEIARVVKHVARAISRAHDAGIVHRDLKPANIFIVPNDDEELIKVLDFGVAKATTIALGSSVQVGATPVGALLGTPHYMSPEQAQGVRTLDYRTDLWAMGIIAYECLLGDVPFTGHSLGSVLTAICSKPPPVPSLTGPVPAGFDAWFARACARRPADRFESAKQMAEEFTRLCEPVRVEDSELAPAYGKRTEIGIAPVQLPMPARVPTRARPEASIRPLLEQSEAPDGAALGLLGNLMRYKLQIVLAAIVAFAAGVALIERQKARLVRPAAPVVVAVTPIESEPSEPFSGLGRRVGPVPEHAKAALSEPVAAAPPAVEVAPVSTAVQATVTPTLTRAPLRPAAAKPSAERVETTGGAECDPPWFVDATGIRRVKPRCL